MSKSIISNTKQCYICGNPQNIHKHHVFYGSSNRSNSEKYGCWIYLCAPHHNMSDMGIHFDKELDLEIKKNCQREFERIYDHDTFLKVFGKSYI